MQPAPETNLTPADMHHTFQADPASVRDVLAGMMTLPPLAVLPVDDRGVAEIVLAEVLNNVAEHAYAEAGGPVSVTLRRVPGGLRCIILDQGKAMPGGTPPAGRLPDLARCALDDLPEGGFGWHLIRTLSTGLTYVRDGQQNRLEFVLPVTA